MSDVLQNRVAQEKTRILSLWLPRLSTDRLIRAGKALPERPFAVFERVRNALRLNAVSAAAEALGVRPGQSLADWKANVVNQLQPDWFFEGMPEVVCQIAPHIKVFMPCDELIRGWLGEVSHQG